MLIQMLLFEIEPEIWICWQIPKLTVSNDQFPCFILQNAARIVRALFEIALRKRWPAMTYKLLNLSKVIDKRLWGWASPLRQFSILPPHILTRLEEKNLSVDKLKDMRKDEIGKKDVKLFDCILCKQNILLNKTLQYIFTLLRSFATVEVVFSLNLKKEVSKFY